MQGAMLYISVVVTVIALLLLLVKPLWGVCGIFFAKPLVDVTWDQTLLFDFKLTELISSFVPLIIFARMIIDDGSRKPFGKMPLKWIWLLWSLDAVMFSSFILFDEDWHSGLSVMMRSLNGLAGFYMLQAYCRDERDFLRVAWALAIAGLFPIGTGLFEAVSGVHWTITLGAEDVIRNIGLYHDAITIRVYALQTIMGLFLIFALSKRSTAITVFCLAYGLAAAFVIKGSYSKSGLFTLGIWALLWMLLRKNYKTLIAIAIGCVLASVYFAKQIMDSVGFVFVSEIGAIQGEVGIEHTFAGRWFIWMDLLKEWNSLGVLAHLFGAGRVASGAHNDYLQAMFHGGFFGLALYVVLLCSVGWTIGRLLWQRCDIWSISALFVFIMWMVDSIGLVPSVYSGYQWFVWGVMGFCLRYRQDEGLRIHDEIATIPSPRFANLLGAS